MIIHQPPTPLGPGMTTSLRTTAPSSRGTRLRWDCRGRGPLRPLCGGRPVPGRRPSSHQGGQRRRPGGASVLGDVEGRGRVRRPLRPDPSGQEDAVRRDASKTRVASPDKRRPTLQGLRGSTIPSRRSRPPSPARCGRHGQRTSRRRPRRDRHAPRTAGRKRLPLQRLPQRRPRHRAARSRPRRGRQRRASSATSAASATRCSDKITTLVTTGKLPFYDDLRKKTPPGLLEMLRIQGLGPKKVKALYDQLGIDDLDKLKAACEAGQVAELKGFGAKTQQKILEGIEFLGQMGDRVRIDQAAAAGPGAARRAARRARRHPHRTVRQPAPAQGNDQRHRHPRQRRRRRADHGRASSTCRASSR